MKFKVGDKVRIKQGEADDIEPWLGLVVPVVEADVYDTIDDNNIMYWVDIGEEVPLNCFEDELELVETM